MRNLLLRHVLPLAGVLVASATLPRLVVDGASRAIVAELSALFPAPEQDAEQPRTAPPSQPRPHGREGRGESARAEFRPRRELRTASLRGELGLAPKTPSIFLPRPFVERAITRGRPAGFSVGKSGDRPAGLVITSAAGFAGVFFPGDILVELNGRKTAAEDDVVEAILAAYRARQRTLSGHVWRDGVLIAATADAPW